MSFRHEEIKKYKNIVICDDCKYEIKLSETPIPMGFSSKMNGALSNGFTFKDYGDGTFKNYCNECKKKYS